MTITILEPDFLDLVPPVLDAESPATVVWHDGDNGAVAFGATRGEWHWFRVAGAGSYRFPTLMTGLTVACGVVPEGGASRAVVIDSFYRSVVPMALQAYGFEVLHGSAVALPGGVVAMCADRETGKSTIAYALQQRGHGAVADDSVVLSLPDQAAVPLPAEDLQVVVHPLPFALRLRGPSAEHFDAPSKSTVLVSSADEPVAEPALPLAAIVMLTRHDGPVELVRLASAEAFAQVLSQAYAFTLEGDPRKRSMMANYLRLVNLVPTYRLAFPAGLEHLASICEQIESLV